MGVNIFTSSLDHGRMYMNALREHILFSPAHPKIAIAPAGRIVYTVIACGMRSNFDTIYVFEAALKSC